MQIYFNENMNNIQFKGHRIKYTNEQLSELLEPLFEQKTPYKLIMTSTRLSHNVINKWAKEVKGMSANKLYKKDNTYDKNKLKNDLIKRRSLGFTHKEIAELYHRSPSWVGEMLKKFNITINRTKLQVAMEENIPRMIQEGYTIEAMTKELGCGHTQVLNWIFKTYNKYLKTLRQENNINIKVRA